MIKDDDDDDDDDDDENSFVTETACGFMPHWGLCQDE